MIKTNTMMSMSFFGLGMLGLCILLADPAGAAGDVTKAAPHDASSEAAKDTARDMARDAKRDGERCDTARISPTGDHDPHPDVCAALDARRQ